MDIILHGVQPDWVSYLQALSTPAIAIAGVTIAWGQLRLAHNRFQYDLYERRLRVFEAAKKLLIVIYQNGDATHDAIYDYVRGTSEAVFLLDDDTVTYLELLRKEAFKLSFLCRQLNQDNLTQDARNRHADDEEKLLGWFFEQLDVLIAKFKRSMRLKLRWRDKFKEHLRRFRRNRAE